MNEIVDWVKRLQAAEHSRQPKLSPNFRRMLIPGWEPAHFDGFLRTQGQHAFTPFGGTPTSFSVLEWLDVARSGAQTLSELPPQIGGLLTLVTDRKVMVLNELDTVLQGTDSHTFLPLYHHADARLASPLNLGGATVNELFRDRLAQLCSISAKKQRVLQEAISLHYGAVLLYEVDLAAAYTLVVAGIEALSREFGEPPSSWSKWDKSEPWDTLMKDIHLKEEQKAKIRAHLMKDKQMRLKETFVNYVIDALPESMWDEDWKEWMYSITMSASGSDYTPGKGQWSRNDKVRDHLTTDREKLRASLKKTYNARSGFVHEGKRSINFLSHIQTTLIPDYNKPLPFSILRTILSALIRYELDRNSSAFKLPEIEIHS